VKIEFKEARTEISPEDLIERKTLAEAALNEIKTSLYDFSVTANKYKLAYENVEI